MKNTQYDLFEKPELIPSEVQEILNEYEEQAMNGFEYAELAELVKKLESIGYTFDYYLDAEPYALRKVGTKINELVGYENF